MGDAVKPVMIADLVVPALAAAINKPEWYVRAKLEAAARRIAEQNERESV